VFTTRTCIQTIKKIINYLLKLNYNARYTLDTVVSLSLSLSHSLWPFSLPVAVSKFFFLPMQLRATQGNIGIEKCLYMHWYKSSIKQHQTKASCMQGKKAQSELQTKRAASKSSKILFWDAFNKGFLCCSPCLWHVWRLLLINKEHKCIEAFAMLSRLMSQTIFIMLYHTNERTSERKEIIIIAATLCSMLPFAIVHSLHCSED